MKMKLEPGDFLEISMVGTEKTVHVAYDADDDEVNVTAVGADSYGREGLVYQLDLPEGDKVESITPEEITVTEKRNTPYSRVYDRLLAELVSLETPTYFELRSKIVARMDNKLDLEKERGLLDRSILESFAEKRYDSSISINPLALTNFIFVFGFDFGLSISKDLGLLSQEDLREDLAHSVTPAS